MTGAEKPAESRTHYRFRLRSGAKTPWQPVPAGYLALPANAEGIEFHEGKPELPPRRATEPAPA